VSTFIASFKAQFFNPSTVQAEGCRQAGKHVGQIQGTHTGLKDGATAASSDSAHHLSTLQRVAWGDFLLAHLLMLSPLRGAFY